MFKDYFETEIGKELAPFVPSFDYLLTNLQQRSDESIRKDFQLLTLQVGFLFLKFSRDEGLLDKVEEILLGIEQLHIDENDQIFLNQIFVYLNSVVKKDHKEVMEKTKKLILATGEYANSAAMQLVRKGMEKTSTLHITNMLLKKMEISLIAEITEYPIQKIKEIEQKLRKEGKLK